MRPSVAGASEGIFVVSRCYCGQQCKPLLVAPFYVLDRDGQMKDLNSILYYCKQCDLAIRGLDYTNPVVLSHYDVASYTDVSAEESWRERRRKLFDWFYELSVKHLGRIPAKILDFGCSYGHLLDRFAKEGSQSTGIEISAGVLNALRSKGRHKLYRNLIECEESSFDVISAIDSLYCTEGDPRTVLKQMSDLLRPAGILITRTTNRNTVYRMHAAWWHLRNGRKDEPAPISYKLCGDAKHGFSRKALSTMLESVGMEVIASYRLEHKAKTTLETMRDIFALCAYYLTFGQFDVCPGLVLVSRKRYKF